MDAFRNGFEKLRGRSPYGKMMREREMQYQRSLVTILECLIFLLIACAGRAERTGDGKEGNRSPYRTAAGQIMQNETFAFFFQRFTSDSAFQHSRIQFPLSYYTFDIEDNKEEYVVAEGDWEFVHFSEDAEAAKRQIDAFAGIIKAINDSEVVYLRKGIDNGIRIEYHFFRENGIWHMTKILDYSN